MLANGEQFLLLIIHRTGRVILIYRLKSGESGSRKTKSKVIDPLSFEIWTFRNGQPNRVDDRSIFVAITSTLEQR